VLSSQHGAESGTVKYETQAMPPKNKYPHIHTTVPKMGKGTLYPQAIPSQQKHHPLPKQRARRQRAAPKTCAACSVAHMLHNISSHRHCGGHVRKQAIAPHHPMALAQLAKGHVITRHWTEHAKPTKPGTASQVAARNPQSPAGHCALNAHAGLCHRSEVITHQW
jgi:hypothetical protein